MPTAFTFAAGAASIDKDPEAVLDYSVLWRDWLAGDLIQSATWDVPAGLTLNSSSVNAAAVTIDGDTYPANTVATAWIAGGTDATSYKVRCRIQTVAGRTNDISFTVVAKHQ